MFSIKFGTVISWLSAELQALGPLVKDWSTLDTQIDVLLSIFVLGIIRIYDMMSSTRAAKKYYFVVLPLFFADIPGNNTRYYNCPAVFCSELMKILQRTWSNTANEYKLWLRLLFHQFEGWQASLHLSVQGLPTNRNHLLGPPQGAPSWG
jgi:hypothetical protein